MASHPEVAASSSKDEISGSGLKALGRSCGGAQLVGAHVSEGASCLERGLSEDHVPSSDRTCWGLSVGAGPRL